MARVGPAEQSSRAATSSARASISHRSIGVAIAALDCLLIATAFLGTKVVYGGPGTRVFGLVEFGTASLFVLLSMTRGLYQLPALRSREKQMKGVCSTWLLASALVVLLALVPEVQNPFSPASAIALFVVAPALLSSGRIVVNDMLQRAAPSGRFGGRRTVMVGDAEELASLTLRDLCQCYGIEQTAAFALHGPIVEAAIVDEIAEAVRRDRADQVAIALPWGDRERIETLLNQLRVLSTRIVLLADRGTRSIASNSVQGEGAAIAIELQKVPLSSSEAVLKRTFDVVMSAAFLCTLAPVLLIIAVVIQADSPGPVLFRQARRGFNGAEFRIRKFRTMSVLEDGATIVQASTNDSRVTRFGRILRRTSLDELPQLLNVLWGDMSLVGPRPHAVAHDIKYSNLVPNYASRFRIKPGITGWAQINGSRGETPQIGSMQKRIEFDLWYISNWSILLDLKIVVLTFCEVVRGRNAF
jgi:undecaprenyl-phosphate galactose phosphotransferase/putative colanic acid biosynthesis UDP-glucose lipid carrier transferase